MIHLLEFHGRVSRADGKAAPAGLADLRFAVYATRDAAVAVWVETLRDVEITPDGSFSVVLGEKNPLDPAVFDGDPRWVSVSAVRGEPAGSGEARTVVLASAVRLARDVAALAGRVRVLEAGASGSPGLRKRTVILRRRIQRLEAGGGPIEATQARVTVVEQTLDRLAGEDGRLVRLEDEIEDLVGPDGDIIDLLERVERLEGTGPAPERVIPSLTPQPRLTPHVIERIDLVDKRLLLLESRPVPPLATAEGLHVVKKAGDVMTGGLVINRGGLDVLSGGIKCRGADVNSLEATLFVKAPKLIGDALEVRGDITVDSTKRTLQIRHIEGRAGSGRKDGGLVLNGRSGSLVEVGSEGTASDGLVVHGPVRAPSVSTPGSSMAIAFQSGGDFKLGEVVGINDQGHLIHTRDAYDPRVVGIVGESPALVLGVGPERKVMVVIAGITRCRVDATGGPIHAGDLLVASAERGHARKADDASRTSGAVVGKALGVHGEGSGEINVLVFSR